MKSRDDIASDPTGDSAAAVVTPLAPREASTPVLNREPDLHREPGLLRRWFRDALEFVYPPGCLWCGDSTSARAAFCGRCRDELVQSGDSWCERCSAPVGPHLNTSGGCVHCH